MNNRTFAVRDALTDAQIRDLAPSVFPTGRHPAMTGRYAFISTAQVLDALRGEGFMPIRAKQASARESVRAGYARHILTFRLTDSPLVAGEDIPEIVLMNAHDGSTAYKLMVGVFRVVCSNGLIVADRTLAAMRVAHVGTRTIAEVVTATHKLVAELPAVLGQVEIWRSTILDHHDQFDYARAALALRYPNRQAPVCPQQILAARRPEDRGDDLWTVFNRVQEHLITGGLAGQITTGRGTRRTTTRPIAAVSTSIMLNRALWTLTAQTAQGISVPAAIEVAGLLDLIAAANVLENAELYRELVAIEIVSTFSFQSDRWLGDVAPHLLDTDQRTGLILAKERAAVRVAAEARIPRHLLYTKGWPTVMPTPAEAQLLAEVRRTVAATVGLTIGYTCEFLH